MTNDPRLCQKLVADDTASKGHAELHKHQNMMKSSPAFFGIYQRVAPQHLRLQKILLHTEGSSDSSWSYLNKYAVVPEKCHAQDKDSGLNVSLAEQLDYLHTAASKKN